MLILTRSQSSVGHFVLLRKYLPQILMYIKKRDRHIKHWSYDVLLILQLLSMIYSWPRKPWGREKLLITQVHFCKWATSWQNQQSDCAPSKDSDQPGHPPSLIRVLAVRMKKAWVLSYPLSAQRRLWSDWSDAQADRSLRWAHSHIVGFVMRRL